jgi:hypothetical protein
MKVRYIENMNTCAFTKGNIYNVDLKKSTNSSYFITDTNDKKPYLYNKHRFEIIKEIENMKKSDLKVGMVVENREKNRYIVLESNTDLCFVRENNHFGTIENIKENLTYYDKAGNGFDIMKVYKIKSSRQFDKILLEDNLTLLWERKDNSEELEKVRNEIKTAQEALKKAEEKLRTLTE